MCGIYTMELISCKNKWNTVICCNMDEPRDYHIKWSNSDKDKYQTISLMCETKKMMQMNLFTNLIYIKNRLMIIKVDNGVERGEVN